MKRMAEASDFKNEDSSANLIVALRIRPMNDDEIIQGATPIAHKVDDNLVVLMDPADDIDDILRQNRSREKQFMYDIALDAKTTQEEVYHRTCKFLIPSVLNGFNATVFAYGATGAGKTYTMLGRDDSPGIMAQALTELFQKMSQSEDDRIYKVTMSYLEIYNEMIRDLLNPGSGFLDLREDHKGVQVAGLSEHGASNTQHVMAILKEGNKQRTQEPTAANKTSSRSHAVLIVNVRQRSRNQGIHQQLRVGKLFLIDLAGSERAANTQNRGKRMVEGAHINRSLLALGNCINALSDKSGSKYVNYRDSKLTRLLKDALGGNCRTVMIAHISPASFYFEESRNTLAYADRAKNIRTKVRQNVLDMTLHISQYSNIITDLREEIKRLKQRLDQQGQLRNNATVQAIQTEVMQRKEDPELTRLKNELQSVYNQQIELRQSLIELINAQSDIKLESTKLHLQMNSWQRSQLIASQDTSDLGDIPGLGPPVDGTKAKQELENLEKERSKTERQKLDIEKQLDNVKNKAMKIEEDLHRFHTSPDQQEMLNLLAKIHRLEADNARLQSELILRSYDVRRRDLLLELAGHHHKVGSELINRQRQLITDSETVYPYELANLFDVYQQEMQDMEYHRNLLLPPIISTSSSSSSKFTLNDDNVLRLPPILFVPENSTPRDDKLLKTFVNSSRRSSRDERTIFKQPSPMFVDSIDMPSGQRSGTSTPTITDISVKRHSRIAEVEDMIVDNEDDRRMMANGNKGIAILAARRRSKVERVNADRIRRINKHRQIFSDHYNNPVPTQTTSLTQSRLAQHNSKYESPVKSDELLSDPTSDKYSNATADTLLQQNRQTNRQKKIPVRMAKPSNYNSNNNNNNSRLIVSKQLYRNYNQPSDIRPGDGSNNFHNPAENKNAILNRLKNQYKAESYPGTLVNDVDNMHASKSPSYRYAGRSDIAITGYGLQQ